MVNDQMVNNFLRCKITTFFWNYQTQIYAIKHIFEIFFRNYLKIRYFCVSFLVSQCFETHCVYQESGNFAKKPKNVRKLYFLVKKKVKNLHI